MQRVQFVYVCPRVFIYVCGVCAGCVCMYVVCARVCARAFVCMQGVCACMQNVCTFAGL